MTTQRTFSRLAIVFFCTAACAMILQGAFDASDHGKAERAVRNYRVADQGRPLGAFLEERAPGGQWSTEITHGCRGVVRATYTTSTTMYAFDYDVPGHLIHPGNEAGKTALEQFVAASKR